MTTIRPELSEKNEYWISKERYYELKHFCLQYPTWERAYNALSMIESPTFDHYPSFSSKKSDPTSHIAIQKKFYYDRMQMVIQAANEANIYLADYIIDAVTTGKSYTYLRTKQQIPCCKDVYYENYRKFFWILNKIRE